MVFLLIFLQSGTLQESGPQMISKRRFPPPWSVDRRLLYSLRRANGQALAYVYFEEEPGRRACTQASGRVGAAKARAPRPPFRAGSFQRG